MEKVLAEVFFIPSRYIMKFKVVMITLSLLLSNSVFSESQDKVGCFVVNESFFAGEPTLLTVPQVALSSDSLTLAQLYQNGKFELLIGNAIIITPTLVKPWVAAFNVIVRKEDGTEIFIRSSQRENNKGIMSTHLSLDNGFKNGKLTIECNSIQS